MNEQQAVDACNKYANIINTLVNEVRAKLSMSKHYLINARAVLNINWEGNKKNEKIKKLNLLIDNISGDIHALDNIIEEARTRMSSIKKQYNIS